jgi:hypothetical protein
MYVRNVLVASVSQTRQQQLFSNPIEDLAISEQRLNAAYRMILLAEGFEHFFGEFFFFLEVIRIF